MRGNGRITMVCAGWMACAASAWSQTAWSTPADGLWRVAGNWSPANVPDTFGESALLGFGTAYTVTVDQSVGLNALTVSNPQARVAVGDGVTFSLGGLSLNGLLQVNAGGGGNTTVLLLGEDAVVGGTGRIALNGSALFRAQIATTSSNTDTATIGEGITITGNGGLYGRLINRGTIGGGAGTGPVVSNRVDQQGAGRVYVDVEGRYAGIGDGGLLVGGVIETANGGVVRSQGTTGAVSGVRNAGTLHIPDGTALRVVSGGLINDGVLVVNPSGGGNTTSLVLAAGAAVGGTGTIELNGSALFRAQITTTGANTDTATLQSGVTVTGRGALYGRLINQGVIGGGIGDGPVVGNWMSQEGGGRISVSGAGRAASIGDGGELVGGVMETANGGVVRAIGTTGSLSGVRNTGTFQVVDGATVRVNAAGVVNDGRIEVNPSGGGNSTLLVLAQNAEIGGTGVVNLNGSALFRAQIATTGGNLDTGVIGAGTRITGNGAIYGRLINRGTIAGGNANGPVVSNWVRQEGAGRMFVDGSGLAASIGDGGLLEGGEIATANGGVVRAIGTTGAVSGVRNTGVVHVTDGAWLRVSAAGIVNNGVVEINPSGGGNTTGIAVSAGGELGGTGEVRLNGSALFRAQIATTSSNTDEAIIGPGTTITGNGAIYGRFINRGVIGGGTGNGPVVSNRVTQVGGGRVEVTVAGRAASIGDGGFLVGGTVRGAGGGSVRAIGTTPAVSDVTNLGVFQVWDGTSLQVRSPGFRNDGVIEVNPTGGGNSTSIVAEEGSVLSGTGRLVLNGSAGFRAALGTGAGNTATARIGAGATVTGIGSIVGNFINEGTIAPGSAIGNIIRDGGLTQTPTGVIEIELGGPAANQRDTLNGGGALRLDGTLRVRFLNGYVLPVGETHTAISGGSVTGRFAAIDAPTVPGRKYSVRYTLSSVTIVGYCAADFNEDGFVDFFDYSDFVEAFEEGSPGADFNNDGFADFFDYGDFVAAFEGGC